KKILAWADAISDVRGDGQPPMPGRLKMLRARRPWSITSIVFASSPAMPDIKASCTATGCASSGKPARRNGTPSLAQPLVPLPSPKRPLGAGIHVVDLPAKIILGLCILRPGQLMQDLHGLFHEAIEVFVAANARWDQPGETGGRFRDAAQVAQRQAH